MNDDTDTTMSEESQPPQDSSPTEVQRETLSNAIQSSHVERLLHSLSPVLQLSFSQDNFTMDTNRTESNTSSSSNNNGDGASNSGSNQNATDEAERSDHNANNPSTYSSDANITAIAEGIEKFFRYINHTLPFLLILIGLFIYIHLTSLMILFWLLSSFSKINAAIINQVSLKESRSVVVLLALLLAIVAHVVIVYGFLDDGKDLLTAFKPVWGRTVTFSNTLWIIMINDLMARYIAMAMKCVAIILVGHLPPFKQRSKLYSFIEVLFSTIRLLLPIIPWILYFIQINQVVAVVGTIAYCGAKQFGVYLTETQLLEEGFDTTCSICQDKFTVPVQLSCKHCFCEDCISSWLERQNSCPLCRAVLPSAGVKLHADGSTTSVFELF